MPDRLVQQDARPARPQHNSHGTGRGRDRLEIHQPLAHRLARQLQGPIPLYQLGERVASAHTGIALLTTTVLLDQHRHVETH